MLVQAQKERQRHHMHRQHKTEGKAKVQRHRVLSDNAGESDNVTDEMHRRRIQANYHRKSGRI